MRWTLSLIFLFGLLALVRGQVYGEAPRFTSQLKVAMDSGLADVISSGTYAEIIQNVANAGDTRTFITTGDCIANTDLYPYPDFQSFTRSEQRIISGTDELTIGDILAAATDSALEYQILYAVVDAMNVAYDTEITTRVVYYDTSYELFQALVNNEIDLMIGAYNPGSTVGPFRRSLLFPHSCPWYSFGLNIATLESTLVDPLAVRSQAQTFRNVTACVDLSVGSAGVPTAQALFQLVPVIPDANCDQSVLDGIYSVGLTTGNIAGVTYFPTGVYINAVAFYPSIGASLV